MRTILLLVSDLFLVVMGWLIGVDISIRGLAVTVTAETSLDFVHPLFQFPMFYYEIGMLAALGFSVLLRLAAKRVA